MVEIADQRTRPQALRSRHTDPSKCAVVRSEYSMKYHCDRAKRIPIVVPTLASLGA